LPETHVIDPELMSLIWDEDYILANGTPSSKGVARLLKGFYVA